jgi:signal peptidase II
MGKRDAGSDAPAKAVSLLYHKNQIKGAAEMRPLLFDGGISMIYAILAAVLVAVDQIVKYLVMTNIALGEHVPFLPYLLDLTYVTNTGAAFSIFSEHTWALALVSLAMSVVLALALWKGLFKHPFGKLALTLLLAGAVGNLIDRAFRGFVVDMFNVLFMDFAVFNVADICVVAGGIAAGIYYLLLMDKLEPRKEAGHDGADAEG